MLERKCDACEADSDWVCRKCYGHIVLESNDREKQLESLRGATRALKAASRKIQRERDDAENLLTFNLVDDPDEQLMVYKSAAEISAARLAEARQVAIKVIDVWRDADSMLAYLRGDPTQLAEAIEAMARVLNYKDNTID
jgi:ribosome-binding protein aMBF1 (putative translation factor)